jgi:uncharacterized coiled-coil protein SlyX
MVDALRRARGWLRTTGVLVDLHPTSAVAKVLVGDLIAGPLQTGSAPTRHQAATDAIASVVREQLFTRVDELEFEHSTYAETLDELEEHILEDWRESRIGDDTMARAQALLRDTPGLRPRVLERVSASKLLPRGDSATFTARDAKLR